MLSLQAPSSPNTVPAIPPNKNDSPYPYQQVFDVGQKKISEELKGLRGYREAHPAWSAMKSSFWFTGALLNQGVQLVGSFVGHLVTAVVVIPLASVPGVVYATGMKAYDCIAGNKDGKSFFDYTLSVVQVSCKVAYNRATDWMCRYLLGPALTFSMVEPLVCLVAAGVGSLVACPFIYRDLKHNQGENVEYLERVMMTPISDVSNFYLWDTFLNLNGKKICAAVNSLIKGKQEGKTTGLKPSGATPPPAKQNCRLSNLTAGQPKLDLSKLPSANTPENTDAKKCIPCHKRNNAGSPS
ncbi:hypothetical protein [Endozoicomonas ascidiicola]|uniref:hypothetical protein n=1 Tax=Endozoicomonas ascidiicola TaxID=1698521 RepID=UPI000830866C|nr:hypothetical protein [Endozoicomonas ascidiicola]